MIRSIKVLSFLALTLSPTAFAGSDASTDQNNIAKTSSRADVNDGVQLFAGVTPKHMVSLVDLALDGGSTRGLSSSDLARVQRISVAIRIYEVVFDFEANFRDALTIAVHQARSEAASHLGERIHPMDVPLLDERDLGLVPGILDLVIVDPNGFPGIITAENPADGLRSQLETLEALESMHENDFINLINQLQSTWPGLSQDLCDEIMGAMIFNGSKFAEALNAAWEAFKAVLNDDHTAAEYGELICEYNLAEAQKKLKAAEDKAEEEKYKRDHPSTAETGNAQAHEDAEGSDVDPCFDKPGFPYFMETQNISGLDLEMMQITQQFDQRIQVLNQRVFLQR